MKQRIKPCNVCNIDFPQCTGYNTKTLRNGCLCARTAYLKLKPITALINTVALGRNENLI